MNIITQHCIPGVHVTCHTADISGLLALKGSSHKHMTTAQRTAVIDNKVDINGKVLYCINHTQSPMQQSKVM